MRKDRVVSEVFSGESAISPSDLYNTTFGKSIFGGYKKRQVDPFLRRVGDVLETLTNQVRELKQQCEYQKDQLEALHEMESTLRTALVSSQRFHEDMIDKAKGEARAIVEEGRAIKERLHTEAQRLPKRIEQEIEGLTRVRDGLRHDLATFLDTQRAFLDELPVAEEIDTSVTEATAEASESEDQAEAFLKSIEEALPETTSPAPHEAPTTREVEDVSSGAAEAEDEEEQAEQLELTTSSHVPSSLGPLPASPLEREDDAVSIDKEPWLEDGPVEKGDDS